jgi:16S rRNA (adenine1518-N6/adenine1519-N6)-dimethyltransferase
MSGSEPRHEPSPKALCERYGVRPKRHFGQNFLADQGLARRIAAAARASGGSVVELGAGLGALTGPLLETAQRVIAVERDRDLVPSLKQEFAAEIAGRRLRVEEADAKTVDLGALFGGLPRPHVLAGNLPYQITGPLLERAVLSAGSIERAVFLVQLEVADRLSAASGTKSYGALSVFTQAAFEVTRPFVVRRGAFYPQPRVDSALVVLESRREPLARETAVFRELVSRAFEQRRKQLKNAWSGAVGLGPRQLSDKAERAGIDLSRRGESLSVREFASMAREVSA